MLRKALVLGLLFALVGGSAVFVACSAGEVPVVRDADASSDAESVPDTSFDACSNYPGPPSTTVYKCDAAPPGAKGCYGTDPPTNVIYPLGCDITRPVQAGSHCGGLTCYCTDQFGAGDAGGQWICPD